MRSKMPPQSEVDLILDKIENATTPEEVFGLFIGDPKSSIRKVYLRIQHVIHPDHAGNTDRTHKMSAKLNTLYADAKEKIRKSVYGDNKPVAQKVPVVIETKLRSYILGDLLKVGATCGVFRTVIHNRGGEVLHGIIKIPHSPTDNDLMTREAEGLKKIKSFVGELRGRYGDDKIVDSLLFHTPRFLESLKIDSKVVNVFTLAPGFEADWYNLEQIHEKYPSGVSLRQSVFIMNRMLQSLSLLHGLGICHGCVLPKHVLIHQPTHAGHLFDWTCSGNPGGRVPYVEKEYKGFYAPELLTSRISTPDSDVYSSAMNMLYVLGGNVDTFEVPDLPDPIKDFLNKCVQPRRFKRFRNAEHAYEEFKKVTESVLGPRTFVELVM